MAYVIVLPLRRPIRHASHSRTNTENVIVRCSLSDGTIGWGEGVPREYVTGESADSALEMLKSTDFSGQIASCPDFVTAVRWVERLTLPSVISDDRDCRGNAARCALEIAVLDAFGRVFGEGLTTVTEIIAPKLFSFRPNCQYSGVITSSRGLKLRALALGYRFTGFHQVKAKVGIDGYDDITRLRIIRRCVGSRVGLRVDANEAWKPEDCAARIQALEPFGLECIEQPMAHESVAALEGVRRRVKTPIMLDESLCSLIDAQRAVEGKWGDQFNLRLSKCGGYIRTLRLAQFAAKHNIKCQLGCQVGESAILSGAGRHFATSVKDLTAIEGSFDRHLLQEQISFGDLTFGRGGWANALGGTGHGAWVDPDAIEHLARRTETLFG